MSKKVVDILYLAKQGGIDIVLNEEELHLKLPKNKSVNKELIDDIRSNKKLIVDFLKENRKVNSKPVSNITRFDRSSAPHIPLSFSQERLWVIDKLEGSVEYNVSSVFHLKGTLNRQALENTLQTLIDRHEALRTVFYQVDGVPYQKIKERNFYTLDVINNSNNKNKPTEVKELVRQLVRKPFNLSKDYMLRSSLISITEQEFYLVITVHHIAADAWSMPIIVQEVVQLYRSYVAGNENQLEQLNLQYADYAVWQRNFLQGDVLNKKLAYWKGKLQEVTALQFPTDFIRPSARSTRGASLDFNVDLELTGQLKEISRQYGASLYMTLLAAFNVLLHRYCNQEDITVGASIANRTIHEVEGLIGFFANTLAFRNYVNGNDSFIDLLKQVKKTTTEAYDHQEVPFEKVVEAVLNERDAGRTPLFQVMLVFLNTGEVPEIQLGDLQLSHESLDSEVSKFDFTFFIKETSEGLVGVVEYSTDLFASSTITRLISHYQHLLSSIVLDPNKRVGYLPMLSEQEH
ncbi:MAG: amino acid adenylation protein, partial [Segetibacter sp.]|nr:amino acid adenylation protein [Segetibacter sp.]